MRIWQRYIPGLIVVVLFAALFQWNPSLSPESRRAREELRSEGLTFSAETFITAISTGNDPVASRFLEAGFDPNSRADGQLPALATAVEENPGLASALLRSGADPNYMEPDGQTPLLRAIRTQSIPLVMRLVQHGADVNLLARAKTKPLEPGTTPLIAAALMQDEEMVRVLLERGADPNRTNASGWSPLMAAAGTPGIVQLLVRSGGNIHAADATGMTPLLSAVDTNDYDSARLLISAGADANARGGLTDSPAIALAARWGDDLMIRLLLGAGADVKARDRFGSSVLHYATRTLADRDGAEVIRNLISKGADPNFPNQEGVLPIEVPITREDIAMVREFVKGGAVPDMKSGRATPLEYARQQLEFAYTPGDRAKAQTILALLESTATHERAGRVPKR